MDIAHGGEPAMPDLTMEMIERITTLANPHMKALNDDVTAAFPNAMYTAALALNLIILLHALDPEDRPDAVHLINQFLVKAGYRLDALS
jgi:hypothetical protein